MEKNKKFGAPKPQPTGRSTVVIDESELLESSPTPSVVTDVLDQDADVTHSTSQSQLQEGLEEMLAVRPSSPVPPIPTTPASRKRKQPQPDSLVVQAVNDLIVLRMRKEARKEVRREARAERKRSEVEIFGQYMKVRLHNLPREKRRPATVKLLQVMNELEAEAEK